MTIRRPSTAEELYAWHRRALANRRPSGPTAEPMTAEEPQCGWYRFREVRGGPWIAARIYCRQVIDEHGELAEPERLLCELAGVEADAMRWWPRLAARPITEEEWNALRRAPRDEHEGHMRAATRAPVDLARTPIRPRRANR